jgi:hypothetical protein
MPCVGRPGPHPIFDLGHSEDGDSRYLSVHRLNEEVFRNGFDSWRLERWGLADAQASKEGRHLFCHPPKPSFEETFTRLSFTSRGNSRVPWKGEIQGHSFQGKIRWNSTRNERRTGRSNGRPVRFVPKSLSPRKDTRLSPGVDDLGRFVPPGSVLRSRAGCGIEFTHLQDIANK